MKKRLSAIFAATLAISAGAVICACADSQSEGSGGNEQNKPGVSFTVSYDTLGGGEVDSQKINNNMLVTVAEAVRKTGYTFDGWNYDGNTYAPGDKLKVTADMTLTAMWTANNYTLKFDANGGVGSMPEVQCTFGTAFDIPDCVFMYAGHNFGGWSDKADGTVKYTDGQNVSDLVAENGGTVTFYAVWADAQAPVFSKPEFAYDKAGGNELELPLDLKDSNLVYVEFGNKTLYKGEFTYDKETGCLVIPEDIILSVPCGESVTVKAITDSDALGETVCRVAVENTIPTEFDEVTVKRFRYGYDRYVSFKLTGDVTVERIVSGDYVLPSDMYDYVGGELRIKPDGINKFTGNVDFTVELSNNDRYSFTVLNNVFFYTDYDITTEHSDVKSNTGLNPMYQYADNVSIVNAPEGSDMTGKVLKITPNTTEVLYDCNRYITLNGPWSNSTWRKLEFKPGKYYAVSFDYYTVGTSNGIFTYESSRDLPSAESFSYELLLGADNDEKLHSFSSVLPYNKIYGNGICIHADFRGGGGEVYVDNFRITELDSTVTVATPEEYGVSSGTGYALDIQGGLDYKLYLGEISLPYTIDSTGKTVIDADDMKLFAIGVNTLRIVTAFGETQVVIPVVNDELARLTETQKNFSYYGDDIEFAGAFSSTATVVSLKHLEKHDISGGAEMYHTDYTVDYKTFASITAGESNGCLRLDKELLRKFYGTTSFRVEFSNGNVQDITINSDIVLAVDYDTVDVHSQTGSASDYISGLYGVSDGISGVETDGSGNKALYVRDTQNCSIIDEPNVFQIKLLASHTHPFYAASGVNSAENLVRVTFDYILSDVTDVKFVTLMENGTDLERNFYDHGGDHGGAAESVGGWSEYRYPLVCDGQKHTFDSGWFAYVDGVPLLRIALPQFEAADGRFVMIDNFVLTKTDKPVTLDMPNYIKGQAEDYKISLKNKTINSLMYNGVDYLATPGQSAALDKTKLDALACGTYKFTAHTNVGDIPVWIPIKSDFVTEIPTTEFNYVFGSGDLVVPGTFGTETLISATRKSKFTANIGQNQDWSLIEFDHSTPELDVSDFVVESNKLTIKQALLEKLYLTTDVTLVFSNGMEHTLKITSNVRYFSDFDDTNVFQWNIKSHENLHMTNDNYMTSLVERDGNHMLRYCPGDGTFGHITDPTYASRCNGVMHMELNQVNLYLHYVNGESLMNADHDYIVTFDYVIVNADGVTPQSYSFLLNDDFYTNPDSEYKKPIQPETGKDGGSFTVRIPGGDTAITCIRIGCDQFSYDKGAICL